MSPEVSIIIPAYNVEAYISKAIYSALEQTEIELEVIVVDDASEDQTVAVAKAIKDTRVQVIISQQNNGAGAARNRAIRVAKGDWLALLDADDWFAPERLEKLLQIQHIRPDVDMIADDVYYIKEHAASPWSTLLSESKECISDIIKIDPMYFLDKDIPIAGGFYLGLTKPLVKRKFLLENRIEFDESIRLSQDFWFYLNCLVHGAHFLFVPQPYYFYRSHSGSLVTTNKSKRLDQFSQAAQEFLQKEIMNDHSDLAELLTKRLSLIEKKIKPYYCVVDQLKNNKWRLAVVSMIKNPYFFVHFLSQVPYILIRRFRYNNRNTNPLRTIYGKSKADSKL